jgi:spoIIIJ-associated protein
LEKIYRAKSLNAAKSLAVSEFSKEGIDDYDIEFEILEQPVKRLFGMKGDYVIKAYSKEKEEDITSLDDIISGTDIVLKHRETVVTERDYSEYTKEVELFEKAEKNLAARQQEAEERRNRGNTPLGEFPSEAVRQYIEKMIRGLCGSDADFDITVTVKDGDARVNITGNRISNVIGRHGDALDSIQYLAGLMKNQTGGEGYRLSVDCNGYRIKRKRSLEQLAERTAEKALRYGHRITLEPMTSYERRIIHNKVSSISGVSSTSYGTEPYRKVVISAGARPKKPMYRD